MSLDFNVVCNVKLIYFFLFSETESSDPIQTDQNRFGFRIKNNSIQTELKLITIFRLDDFLP